MRKVAGASAQAKPFRGTGWLASSDIEHGLPLLYITTTHCYTS